MKAYGLARHCFFGEYSAKIALRFDDAESASLALPALKQDFNDPVSDACGRRVEPRGWFQPSEVPDLLYVWCADDDLLAVVDRLVAFGAVREKILSLAHSIDSEEPFDVDVPIVDDPRQGDLFVVNNQIQGE